MLRRVRTAQVYAVGFLFFVALGSIAYVVFRLHQSHSRVVKHIWNGLKSRQRLDPDSGPEAVLKIWPSSSVHVVDEAYCRGDSFCLKNIVKNPVLSYVRFNRQRLILHGIDKAQPLLQAIPLKSYFGEDEFELVVLPQTELNTGVECDTVLQDGPVIVDYPYHCSNAFHVHNDNIFKHLISADMVGRVGQLDQVTLLQRRAVCHPIELLKRWYEVFRRVLPLAEQLRHNKTLCIRQVQFSQAAFEIFNRGDVRGNRPLPSSKTSERLVDIFREIFSTSIRKVPIHGIVDHSSAKGKLVVLLGRNATRKFREIKAADKLLIKEAFLSRNLRFKTFQTRQDYHDLDKLWAALAEASILIGPHGAALMNALYARRNALLLEFRTRYSRDYRYFETMSSFLGIQHVHVDLQKYSNGDANATKKDIGAFADRVIDIFEGRLQMHANSVVNMLPFVNASVGPVHN